MGFTEAQIAVKALEGISGDYTAKSVNQAFKSTKDFKTDILCKPWYYGDAPLHIPNNTDRTVTPKGGHMVEKESCFPISDVDPAIAQVRKIEGGQ
jgi:branched-chain amino acid transport system substrate-binding protein